MGTNGANSVLYNYANTNAQLTLGPGILVRGTGYVHDTNAIDGGIVVKALLVAGLWLAGWGASRLVAVVVPEAGVGGQFVAITLAIWNPYVGERLLQGHWSLLLGYGCLPWVATTMLTLRSGLAGLFGLAFWIALAGLTLLVAAIAILSANRLVAAPLLRIADQLKHIEEFRLDRVIRLASTLRHAGRLVPFRHPDR